MSTRYSYLIRRRSEIEIEQLKKEHAIQSQSGLYDFGKRTHLDEPCEFVVFRTDIKTGKTEREDLSKVSPETLYILLTENIEISQQSMETRGVMNAFYSVVNERMTFDDLSVMLSKALEQNLTLRTIDKLFGRYSSYNQIMNMAGELASAEGNRRCELTNFIDAVELFRSTSESDCKTK